MKADEDCRCKCHREHVAEAVPFCIGCDNSYSDLCTRDRLTLADAIALVYEVGKTVARGNRPYR